jgi:hypothetical protein
MLDTRKEEERDGMKAALLKRNDLDWASVQAALKAGPYYQKPLETAFGERSSKSSFDLVWSGEDGKPRGFLMWVPKAYDAKTPLPVLFYLHHDPNVEHTQGGVERAGQGLVRFKKLAEERGMFIVAPFTSRGAEWWTAEGRKLVAWTLKQVRQRYSIDDDRIGLVGSVGGGDAVWFLGQEMAGTWSSLLPMTGDPYEITALIRPLFLGTLDRMDVLMGVPARTMSTVGDKPIDRFLADLGPMFNQRLRITASIWPLAQGDFSYLEQVAPQIISFVADRKRNAYADEVDIETEAGTPLRVLWLANEGYDPEGTSAPGHHDFKTTLLKWTAPERKEPEKRIGVEPGMRDGVPGLILRNVSGEGEASRSQVFAGDVLLEADGVPITKLEDLRAVLDKVAWGGEVRLLLARDVKEKDLATHERSEARYKRFRAKVKELEDAGKPVPAKLWEEMEDEGPGEEEGPGAKEEDDDAGISISDDAEKEEEQATGREFKETVKVVKIVERWVRIRKPAGGSLVRADFGAQWDRAYNKTEGVRVAGVYAGSLAGRAGFKEGDLIVGVGDTEVKSIYDIEDYFATVDDGKPFKFDEEPDGKNQIGFTIRRPNTDGTFGADQGITVTWKPVKSSRVDAKWDKKENTLNVIANNVSAFTLYFNEELVAPDKEFHLFINDVPYKDLVDPATAPNYPRHLDDAAAADEVYRMRRARAKVEGWKPDPVFAIEDFLGSWDRRQVYGAKRTIDMTKLKAGFEKAKERGKKEDDFPQRVQKAYDEHAGRGKG